MLGRLRKAHPPSPGAPRSNKPRCSCGAMTLARASARGHKCDCYEPGDLVKVDFGPELLWVRVDSSDPTTRLVHGRLENVPLRGSGRRVSVPLTVSFDKIREHLKRVP